MRATNKISNDEEKPGDASANRGNGVLVASFAELQRMRLRKLQIKLIIQSMEMRYKGEESAGWEETLQEYSKDSSIPVNNIAFNAVSFSPDSKR